MTTRFNLKKATCALQGFLCRAFGDTKELTVLGSVASIFYLLQSLGFEIKHLKGICHLRNPAGQTLCCCFFC